MCQQAIAAASRQTGEFLNTGPRTGAAWVDKHHERIALGGQSKPALVGPVTRCGAGLRGRQLVAHQHPKTASDDCVPEQPGTPDQGRRSKCLRRGVAAFVSIIQLARHRRLYPWFDLVDYGRQFFDRASDSLGVVRTFLGRLGCVLHIPGHQQLGLLRCPRCCHFDTVRCES